MQVTGIIEVKINGQLMRTKEGSTKLKLGGKTREAAKGGQRVHGYVEKMVESEFETTIIHAADIDTVELDALTEATVECLTDTGKTYVIPNAFTIEPGELSEGEGDFTLKMQGEPGFEA